MTKRRRRRGGGEEEEEDGTSTATRRRTRTGGEVVSNVVFMGMGEPLHNIDAVLAAVDVLLDDRGLGFSKNKVTVSTSGLVPEIERYLAESQGSLAVSLNATTDEIRKLDHADQSGSTTWSGFLDCAVAGQLSAARSRGRHQRREVFFEYIMLEGVNDSDEDADRLVEIARDIPCKINLIYFNTHDGSEFKCSDQETNQRVSPARQRCGRDVHDSTVSRGRRDVARADSSASRTTRQTGNLRRRG